MSNLLKSTSFKAQLNLGDVGGVGQDTILSVSIEDCSDRRYHVPKEWNETVWRAEANMGVAALGPSPQVALDNLREATKRLLGKLVEIRLPEMK